MNFEILSKCLLWRSLSWRLRQHLWCHRVQLSIHFVHRNSGLHQFCKHFGKNYDSWLESSYKSFFWFVFGGRFLHKMNGELSTMTSQMLTKLRTQGSPQQGFTETFKIHNSWTDFALKFIIYSSWSSPFTKSTLMLEFHSPLNLTYIRT